MKLWIHVALLALTGNALSARGEVLYFEDFESGDGGWAQWFPGDSWEYGIPVAGPGAAYSGDFCWGTTLDGVQPESGTLRSPLIDVSGAAGVGIVVSWWQFIDDEPSYRHVARIANESGWLGQDLFGRWYPQDDDEPVGSGWHRMRSYLGPDFTAEPVRLSFRASGGWAIDDVRIERASAVAIDVEDFEDGPGGFHSELVWARGMAKGCPWGTYEPPSGENHWGTSLPGCGYPGGASNIDLLSRPVDLTPFANRHEVYVHWMRSAYLEGADGVLHAVSYDGGSTWDDLGGRQWDASSFGFGTFTSFGAPFDPSASDSVTFRFRLESDTIESEYGMWIDDFTVSVPEDVPGSGANAVNSLARTSGAFSLGSPVQLALDDPADSFGAGTLGLLVVSLAPDANLPAGTSIPGWNLSTPGAAGDLLVDLAAPTAFFVGSAWSPSEASLVDLVVPNSPALLDAELWLQGLLVDASGPFPRFGATTGLFEKIGD